VPLTGAVEEVGPFRQFLEGELMHQVVHRQPLGAAYAQQRLVAQAINHKRRHARYLFGLHATKGATKKRQLRQSDLLLRRKQLPGMIEDGAQAALLWRQVAQIGGKKVQVVRCDSRSAGRSAPESR
jgi:hypothetical protein